MVAGMNVGWYYQTEPYTISRARSHIENWRSPINTTQSQFMHKSLVYAISVKLDNKKKINGQSRATFPFYLIL